MNTLYQKSTKINIFHAHTFYRYVYMYIYYMQTLLIQSTATTRLVLDAENWSVQFKFGNSLWGFLERWRDSREAVKKCQERVMDNCGQARLSLPSTPTRRGEDLDNLRFFCLITEVTQGCVSAGLGVWGWKMGEKRIIPYRKASLLLSSVGSVFACTGREMVLSLPLDFLE